MFRLAIVFLSVFLISTEDVNSQGISIEDRFAHFQFQLADASDRMSVLIEKVSLDDSLDIVPVFDGNGVNISSDVERHLSSLRTFQRVVFGSKGKRRRLDAVQYSLFANGGLSKSIREAQLIHEHEGWYCNQTQKGVSHFQVKAGVFDMVTETRWKHPFLIATTNGGGMLVDRAADWTLFQSKTLTEGTLKDGRKEMVMTNNQGGVARLVFHEEDWFINEIEFMSREMSKEEEWELVKGGVPKPVTQEMLKEYSTYATNRTEWKEIEENQWVPWVTRISSKMAKGQVEYEIRFRDWKFKEDVDESLLEEENFTPEKIKASINFYGIRDMFD